MLEGRSQLELGLTVPGLRTKRRNAKQKGQRRGRVSKVSRIQQVELLDQVFRDPAVKQGLKFFSGRERERLQLRRNADDKIEVYCLKREKWLRAKPEEIVRQLFLVWATDSLGYALRRVEVEWPMQIGEDAEKERADIVIFTDDACTDPFIVFELKKPNSLDGLEQLRSYLRWTGCFFGCWSNGSEHSFQLKEENQQTKKGPYQFRDIGRLPKNGQGLDDILKPLTFAELTPILDMRDLVQRLEHDALANAGVNAFDELFKLLFAKLHDEFRPRRKESDPVDFRVPAGAPDAMAHSISFSPILHLPERLRARRSYLLSISMNSRALVR